MSSENWLMEEAKKAKENTNTWPQWRKESVTTSKAYGYTGKSSFSSSASEQSKTAQKSSK